MVLNYDVNGDGRQIAVELYGTLHFDGGDASGAPQVPSFAFHSSLQACQALALGRYPLHFLCTCLCELISPASRVNREEQNIKSRLTEEAFANGLPDEASSLVRDANTRSHNGICAAARNAQTST